MSQTLFPRMGNAVRIGHNQHPRRERHLIHEWLHMAVHADRLHIFIIHRLILRRFDDYGTVGIAADDRRLRIEVGAHHRQRAGHLLVLHGIEIIMHGPGNRPVTGSIGDELGGFVHHPAAGMVGCQTISLPIRNNRRNAAMRPFHNITGIATDFRSIFRSLGHPNLNFHIIHLP